MLSDSMNRSSLSVAERAPKSRVVVHVTKPDGNHNDTGNNNVDSNNNLLSTHEMETKNMGNQQNNVFKDKSIEISNLEDVKSQNQNTTSTSEKPTESATTNGIRISSTIIDCTKYSHGDDMNVDKGNANISSELEELSPHAFQFIKDHAASKGMKKCELLMQPISFVGENSYGAIMQICIRSVDQRQQQKQEQIITNESNMNVNNKNVPEDVIYVVKISPKNPARRAQMLVVDFYVREVFMYKQVFNEFYKLHQERTTKLQKIQQEENYNWQQQHSNYHNQRSFRKHHNEKDLDRHFFDDLQQQKKKRIIKSTDCHKFDAVPEMYYASLELNDEFIVFEDLRLKGYEKNCRMRMPTYDLVINAFRAIAQLHAMSFVLQSYKPEVFQSLVVQMKENLFSENMDKLTLDFGRYYVKRIMELIRQDPEQQKQQQQQQLKIDILYKIEKNFKSICTKCVRGANAAPYSVICHGDFWNNNILYKYDTNNRAISAKLIDFQISRYAPPVLDLVHYLFACTEKELRDKYFIEFMDFYHHSLSQYLEDYDLSIEQIYPKHVFLQQLRDYGVYGLCISAFGIPFFIANSNEYPDFDEKATALSNETMSKNTDKTDNEKNGHLNGHDLEEKPQITEQDQKGSTNCTDEQHLEILSERTLPIFKRRMTGIIDDLIQYDMIENILQL